MNDELLTKAQEHTRKFQPGDKVLFNGDYPGTVIRYYSDGMIEVRGERGLVCIPEEDARAIAGGKQ